MMLMAGGKYKKRRYRKENHIIGYNPDPNDPLFICGRGVYPEDNDIEATEKGKTCAACNTGWKTQLERKQWEQSLNRDKQTLDSSPITLDEYRQAFGEDWEREQKQFELRVEWVRQQFDGEMIEDE